MNIKSLQIVKRTTDTASILSSRRFHFHRRGNFKN